MSLEMKKRRIEVQINESLLNAAIRSFGGSPTEAAEAAIREGLRVKRVLGLQDHFGHVEWQGDPDAMRGSDPPTDSDA